MPTLTASKESDVQISLELADFVVGLVDSVLHLPDGQAKFLGKMLEEFKLQKYSVRDEILGEK